MFAQGPQKGPIPIPLNLENRTPVRAPALFSLSHPCPKRWPKGFQKYPQGTLKSTKNSNKTVFNKKPQIDTDSLSCFWSPKKLKWSPRHPKRHQIQFQKGPKVRLRTDSSKRPSFSWNGCQDVLPKRLKFDLNPFKRSLSKRLEWNKLGGVANTIDD